MKKLFVLLLAAAAACHETRPAPPAATAGDAKAGASKESARPAQGAAQDGAKAAAAGQGAAAAGQGAAAAGEGAAATSAPLPGEETSLGAQPKLPPIAAFEAPVPRVVTLENGLKVYLARRMGDGIEALDLVVRHGASSEPQAQPGLASLTAALMETGAGGRSQVQLAQEIDAIGATLHVGASQDATVMIVSAMSGRLGEMVRLLSDVALRPNLAADEWKHVREQRRAALVAQRAEPAVGAGRIFRAAAYGAHPLGRPIEGTLESVEAMKLADVKAFYAGLSPKDAAIFAVGGASDDEVLAAVRERFGKWQAPKTKAAARSAESAAPAERPRLVMVDFPGKPQSVVLVGQPSVARKSSDYLPLEALNAVLGGSFTSRLNQNLREAHGYSYGAGSGFAWGKGPGPFVARSSVKTEVTGAALGEMLGELRRAVDEPMSQAELDKAKALLAFDLVEQLSHADSLAGALAQIFLYDLPLDEYRTFVPRLQSLSVEGIREAARRALQPESMTIAIAGDVKQVEAQLAQLKLPAPQLRDATGARISGK